MTWDRRQLWRPSSQQIRSEVDEEIRFHFELRVRELERSGYLPAEARIEAARRFGDVSETMEACTMSDLRRERRRQRNERFRNVLQDTRHGLRQLTLRPAFSAVAVLTLGVAIAANAAIYAVADHVLLRPLPYDDPERIVTLFEVDNTGARADVSPGNYLDWKEQAHSFAAIGLADPFSMDLTGEGPPETLDTWLVSEGFFAALGVQPIIGRLFEPREYVAAGIDEATKTAASRVVAISHAAWQRRFGGSPDVLGRTLVLDGVAHEVVGVMPPSLEYPEPAELWAPKAFDAYERTDRRSSYMYAVARLAPGVTVAQAQAELDAVGFRLAEEHAANRGRAVAVVPLTEQVLGATRPTMLALMIATGLLLLIACANIANLLVSRGLQRSGELALRAALGAGRGRLARQLMTESLVLSALGGVLGVLLAYAGIRALLVLAPPDLPRLSAVALDGRVLLFLIALTAVTGAVFGLVPSLRLSRPNLMVTLRGGVAIAAREHERLRRVLVSIEIGLCFVLLIGAGLLMRSMITLMSNDLGFATDRRAEVQIFLWDNNPSAEQRVVRVRELLARFEAVPGVSDAAAVSALPFHPHAITARGGLRIEGAEEDLPEGTRVRTTVVTPDYFDVLEIPLLRGRAFTAADAAGSIPVVMINDVLARTYFRGENPIGRRIWGGVMSAPITREIVGVVADVRPSAFDSEPEPELYVPHAQSGTGSMTFVVRSDVPAETLLEPLRAAVWAIDPTQTVYHAATLDELVSTTLASRRFQLVLIGLFGAIALALVVLGVYGVIALWARQRQREFGVRLALGASPGAIVRLVTRQGVGMAAYGVAVGVAVAVVVTRGLAHALYGVRPNDLLTFVGVSMVVLLVAAGASYLPARHAARNDPARSLRAE